MPRFPVLFSRPDTSVGLPLQFYMLGVPEQAMRGIPLGFGIVMEEKPSALSCTFCATTTPTPSFSVLHTENERGLVSITCTCTKIAVIKIPLSAVIRVTSRNEKVTISFYQPRFMCPAHASGHAHQGHTHICNH